MINIVVNSEDKGINLAYVRAIPFKKLGEGMSASLKKFSKG